MSPTHGMTSAFAVFFIIPQPLYRDIHPLAIFIISLTNKARLRILRASETSSYQSLYSKTNPTHTGKGKP
jgi:hypothetical protein